MPEGFEKGEMPEGIEAGAMPQGNGTGEGSTVFTVNAGANQFSQIGEATETAAEGETEAATGAI